MWQGNLWWILFVKIIFLGYDDENGSYFKVLYDYFVYRYEVFEVLGKGLFGQVVKVLDYKMGKYVVVKIICNKKRYDSEELFLWLDCWFFCFYISFFNKIRY